MYDLGIVLEGLSGILQPKPLLLMVGGMAISSIFAAVPGVGSLLFLSMVVPYAMTLTPYECIALVLGIATVSNTANTFSSVTAFMNPSGAMMRMRPASTSSWEATPRTPP